MTKIVVVVVVIILVAICLSIKSRRLFNNTESRSQWKENPLIMIRFIKNEADNNMNMRALYGIILV